MLASRQSIINEASPRQLLTISSGEPRQGSNIKTLSDEVFFHLRSAVFDPLIDALKGRKRLLLAPDGNLSRVPFEVLPLNNDGRCLIDEYFITYLSTGRDILRFGNVVSGLSIDPLVAADPDFDFGISSGGSGDDVVSATHKTPILQSRHSRELYQSTTVHFGQLLVQRQRASV